MDTTQKNTTPTDDWEVTANRFVAYIDIMGFKDMVAREKHEDIYKLMIRMKERINFSERVDWSYEKSTFVRTTTYSDSIMIYSKDRTDNSLNSFLCTIASIIGDLFLEEIPFKGAVAFGKMTLDTKNSIFFGQPLIDAYLLEEELHFYGVVIHATAEKEIYNRRDEILSPRVFLQYYPCHFKNGISKHLTVFPMNAIIYENQKTESESNLYKLLESINCLRHKTSGHLRKYIENTEAYLQFIKDNSVFDGF